MINLKTKGPNVLVVTDDEPLRAIMEGWLRQRQFSTRFSNWDDLQRGDFRKKGTAVVLLDMRNQSAKAIELLSGSSQQIDRPEFILVTENTSVSWALEGMRRGAFGEVLVPCDEATLTGMVQAALQRRREHRPARPKRLGKVFEDAMVAATFAQAGEFETAVEFLQQDAITPDARQTPATGRALEHRPEHLKEEPA